MPDADPRSLVGETIQERLEEFFDGDPEAALEWLAESLGGFERALGVLSGGPRDLSTRECELISKRLHLDCELLSALARPTSAEVLLHTCRSVFGAHHGAAAGCPVCLSLEQSLAAIDESSGQEINEVAARILSHLDVGPEAPVDVAGAERMGLLVGVASSLSAAAQLRLLAAAYEEASRTAHLQPPSLLTVLYRLRDEYMSERCRLALDCLGRSADGDLSRRELAAQLGVEEDGLAQLDRDMARAVHLFVSDNPSLQVPAPIVRYHLIVRQGYRVRDEFLAPLRAILAAEQDLSAQPAARRSPPRPGAGPSPA